MTRDQLASAAGTGWFRADSSGAISCCNCRVVSGCAVVGAGIARVDFRLVFGYRLIFAALWFVMGVLAFTFLPC